MRLNDSEVERFREDGFLILPSRFSAEEVDVLKAELPRLYAERRPENFREKASDAVRTAMGLHLRSEVYARVVRDPRLVAPAQQLLGEDLYVQQVKVNAKAAFSGDVWQWHYDFATHHGEDGVPEPLALNLHILLDEVNEFNGPLVFIRGSHRRGPAPATLDTETTSYPLWVVDDDTVAEPHRRRRPRVGQGSARHDAHLRRHPGARLVAQHVALAAHHLLAHREPGLERPHPRPAPGPPAPPGPHPRRTPPRRLPARGRPRTGGGARVNRIVFGENLAWLEHAPREAFSLIYIDPPFNTGRRQARTRLRTVADGNGDRVGIPGQAISDRTPRRPRGSTTGSTTTSASSGSASRRRAGP